MYLSPNLIDSIFVAVITVQGQLTTIILRRVCRLWNNFIKIRPSYRNKYSNCLAACNDKIVKWLLLETSIPKDSYILNNVVSRNNIELYYLATKICRMFGDDSTCERAAKIGNLYILAAAYGNGVYVDGDACSEVAARNGHVNILRWLEQIDVLLHSRICNIAAQAGQLDILEWLYKSTDMQLTQDTCWCAAESGNLEVLKWVIANGCELTDFAIRRAALSFNLNIVQFAYHEGHRIDFDYICETFIEEGKIDVLQWVKKEHGWISRRTFELAAFFGHLHVLQWCYENRCSYFEQHPPEYTIPVDDAPCIAAASSNKLNVLKWLRHHAFPWNNQVYQVANERIHAPLLNGLVKMDVPNKNNFFIKIDAILIDPRRVAAERVLKKRKRDQTDE